MTLTTFPSRMSPGLCLSANSSHSLGMNSLIDSETRWFSTSMLVIRALTVSPFLSTSLGCLTRLVQLMSETWIRPSMPSVISTKAPNSVRLRTLPSMTLPSGWVSSSSSHGLRSVWRSDRLMRRWSMSSSETIASTSSPTSRILAGLTTFLVHDISLTWIRPSTPSSISTKAP